jgi:hypothetical protein
MCGTRSSHHTVSVVQSFLFPFPPLSPGTDSRTPFRVRYLTRTRSRRPNQQILAYQDTMQALRQSSVRLSEPNVGARTVISSLIRTRCNRKKIRIVSFTESRRSDSHQFAYQDPMQAPGQSSVRLSGPDAGARTVISSLIRTQCRRSNHQLFAHQEHALKFGFSHRLTIGCPKRFQDKIILV